MSPRATKLSLFVILALYLIIGAQYAALTPAWQVPDEPAHYNYIRHIATTGTLPILQKGDYDQAYLAELTSTGFPPNKPIAWLQYEAHQPPTYYFLLTPLFLLTGGDLFALRLASLLLGAGVIVFAYLVARELFPDDRLLALTAAGFVAFVPQHVAMMAGVNNDSLAELISGATLWQALRGLNSGAEKGNRGNQGTLPRFGFWFWNFGILGLFIGFAFLTKTTAYVVAPVVATALLLKARPSPSALRPSPFALRNSQFAIRTLAQEASFIFVPAFALGALWWGRNLIVYGWPDFLGLARHNEVVIGQPRTAEWIAKFGAVEFVTMFAVTTFRSFWGQFGWMGVVMDERVYWGLAAFSVLVIVGIAVRVLPRSPAHLLTRQRDSALLLITSFLLTLAFYLYYNLTFVQHQGRYLFPALIPIAVGAAVGLTSLAQVGVSSWNRKDAKTAKGLNLALFASSRFIFGWPALAAIALLAALDLFALYRFIIPALPRY